MRVYLPACFIAGLLTLLLGAATHPVLADGYARAGEDQPHHADVTPPTGQDANNGGNQSQAYPPMDKHKTVAGSGTAKAGGDSAGKAQSAPSVALLPGRSDSQLDYVSDLLARGQYAQAISVLGDVLKRNPANADAYSYLGFANMQLGDLDTAESKLRLALKIDSRHLGANEHLGEVFAKRGQLKRALDQLTVLKMLCRTSSCPEREALESYINLASKG